MFKDMSNAKDIAEHGTAFCAAALPFLTASAAVSGVAAVAVPAATLTAIGYTIWKSCGRRACSRASDAALAQLRTSHDFASEDLDRAALLLRNAPRPVDLSPTNLRQAAATSDFDCSLARLLTEALTEPTDHALRNILMPVFEIAVSVCRRDPDFHRDLTQDLLIDAARQNGLQLQLLERIDLRTAATQRAIDNIGVRLDDIAALSRDALEAIALRFGVNEPEAMSLGDLRGFLIEKSKDYRRVVAQVQKLEDREGRIANLKAAAEEAVCALHFNEARRLIRDAIALQRTERTLAALRDDAALVETEAEIALLGGDFEEGNRLLSAAAESFTPFDAAEMGQRCLSYAHTLWNYGERFGGMGAERAARMTGRALANDAVCAERLLAARLLGMQANALHSQRIRHSGHESATLLGAAIAAYRHAAVLFDGLGERRFWAVAQNNLASTLEQQGRRAGGTAGAALLLEAAAAYRGVLEVFTEAEYPISWAQTQNNLGIVLWAQGAAAEGKETASRLNDAVVAHRAALRVVTEAEHPVDWAKAQHNLGIALKERGATELDAALILEAVACFQGALRVFTTAEHPLSWAQTQHNLGGALMEQGRQTAGPKGLELLREAIAAYEAALTLRTAAEHPAAWAMSMENLGRVQEALALHPERIGRADKLADLERAVTCLEAALRVYDPVHMADRHAKTSTVLERVRERLGRGDDRSVPHC